MPKAGTVMPEGVSIELNTDERTSFGLGDHTADQETQNDQGISSGQPESGKSDPTKTGTY